MEQLQSLLREYNLSHSEDFTVAPWSKQYCEQTFPKYWEIVYSILRILGKGNRIIEVGCGLGDVTTILCYLGFEHIMAFEKNVQICHLAQRRITDMFGRGGIIKNENFPNGQNYPADILILVNCAYVDLANSKEEYMDLMRKYYVSAGCPKYYLMEVIDSSYTRENDEFPEYIRLSHNDVNKLFPGCMIKSWETYKYPINRKSKTLYLIEKA